MGLKDKYAIVAIGYTPQGRVPGRSSLSYHLEACINAMADAGVGQRKWANLNPAATLYDRPMTFEDYYHARWIVEPFRLLDI